MDTTEHPRDEIEIRREKREALKVKHAQKVSTLMSQRDDLHGVHALADFVNDAVRWTA